MKSAANTPSNTKRSQPPRKSGLNVYDILFVLFKHKWKIMFFAMLGFGGAGALIYRDTRSPIFETQAKLLVRYVVERNSVDTFESKQNGGAEVMDTEIEILTSTDVALQVATKIGPEKILTEKEPPPTETAAAAQITKNLKVVTTRGSSIIHLAYSHADPEVAVSVLKQLIETYFERHLEIHRNTGAFESVARQTDQARSRLSQTEAELSKLSSDSGFLTPTDAKTALEKQRNLVRSSLMSAQVELTEQQVKVASLAAAMGVLEPDANQPDKPDAEPKAGPKPTQPAEEPTPERMARIRAEEKYRDLAEQLAMFKGRRNSLMMTRKPSDPMLMALDRQIVEVRQQGLDLIEQYPGLASQMKTPDGAPAPLDLNMERAKLESLGAKNKLLTDQLARVEAEIEKISASCLTFANLERRRQLEEEKYRYSETSLEKARLDETLNPASMPNIGVVQTPSEPTQSLPENTAKHALAIAAAGMLIGLTIAFLIEWVFDRRVSRPVEIQARLQLPLMMSIPHIRSRDGMEKLFLHDSGYKLLGDSGDLALPMEPVNGSNRKRKSAQPEPEHFIMPYAGAIRDRIMFGFELNNITHKPKLIGLTSLSVGAGTSTLAIAMAKAFAENGKFKVLLVDLNGKWSAKLPEAPVETLHSALGFSRTPSFRQNPRSLYYASAPTRRAGRGAQTLASIAMHELIPQLEVCDFDYVIFDMPPVAPTSPTLSMAGFLDKVLLVLDAENTNRENLSWSYGELEKGRADVSCVFNKTKSVAPRWVAGEI